jgi:5-oxoprolinase (ATP-hydrolysing)/N-methylhydantoinase A
VLDAAGHEILNCGTGQLVELRHPNEVVELVLAGGSGYGAPQERQPAELARDQQLGLVSAQAANHDYGQPSLPAPVTPAAVVTAVAFSH